MVVRTAGVPPLTEPELVAHVFLPGNGPYASQAHELLQDIWARCHEHLHLTEPISLPGDPHPSVVTMRESVDRDCQGVLRREHDVFNLSLLLALPEASGGPSAWKRMDRMLDTVIGDDASALIGMARLYLGRSAGLADPAAAGSGIADLVPGAARSGPWWKHPAMTASGLVAWEAGPLDEGRAERRVVVLAPLDGDRPLSTWTWSDGGPGMPPLARHLMHAAKIHYEMRVRSRAVPAGRLCREIDEGTDRVRELIDPGARDSGGRLAERLAELRARRARAASLIGGLEAMRRTVEIARANGDMALDDGVNGADGVFGEERERAELFERRLEDDIAYLRSSAESARQVAEIAAEAVAAREQEGTRSRSRPRPVVEPDPSPVFGLVTALPEEFAAMAALVDDRERGNVEGDRANYVLGTLPGRDPEHPHPVVLTMFGDTANDPAADGCTNLIRSFPSLSHILMVGIAAGVPDPGRPERHVRLGDIVVSTWGIVDYDHVIDSVPEPVLRQPFPRPSRLLAQHAQWLTAQELFGMRPWEQWIVRGQSGLPAYARPADGTDVLYLTDDAEPPIPHPDPAESGHRPGWPKVHHGFIGSADRSLRNARTRDALAVKYDLRAFEMEGKGVGNAAFANGLEWLVIRGVSDYGDSRTGTRWRKYASLVAAAYTRALLAECPPVGPRGGHTGGVRSGW